MKVYKFFKIPNIDDDHKIDLERKYVLYAITNNKVYAERFKEDRNMKKFIFKVHQNVTKEEYAEMCNEERGAVLDFFKLDTIFDDNHTRPNIKQCDVLMTYWERQLLDEPNTILDDESIWQSMPFPLIFKSKYFKALDEFEYVTYYKLMSVERLTDNLARKLAETDDDYSAPAISHDEVALFIDIIRDTL